jgi:hypothetical protein
LLRFVRSLETFRHGAFPKFNKASLSDQSLLNFFIIRIQIEKCLLFFFLWLFLNWIMKLIDTYFSGDRIAVIFCWFSSNWIHFHKVSFLENYRRNTFLFGLKKFIELLIKLVFLFYFHSNSSVSSSCSGKIRKIVIIIQIRIKMFDFIIIRVEWLVEWLASTVGGDFILLERMYNIGSRVSLNGILNI